MVLSCEGGASRHKSIGEGNQMRHQLFILAIALATQYSTPCFADLVGYVGNINGQYSVAADPTATSVEVAASPLSAGSGLGIGSGPHFTFNSWGGSSFDTSIAGNDYFRWGFDVIGDVDIELTTLGIRLKTILNGVRNIEIRAVVSQLATSAEFSVFTESSLSTSGTSYPSIDLSTLPILSKGDSIVFTLGGWGASSAGRTLAIEPFQGELGLIVSGAVNPAIAAIPEPSAFLFGLIAAAGAAAYRIRSGRS